MNLGTCAACGGSDVWRSSSRLRHLQRTVFNLGHRYCASCGERWHVGSFEDARLPTKVISRVLLAITIIAVVLMFAGSHPVNWIKTQVRALSDAEYGQASRKFLWSVLGGFYGSKDEAKSDYNSHKR